MLSITCFKERQVLASSHCFISQIVCSQVFPSLPLPFRVAELEELDEIAVAKFPALEELDDCTDVIMAHRKIATEKCLC
jgi:hypothetical protein